MLTRTEVVERQPQQLSTVNVRSRVESRVSTSEADITPDRIKPLPRLKLGESALAILFFGLWLSLFTGGILVDTRPSRCLISAEGVRALEKEADYRNNPCYPFSKVTGTMLVLASGKVLLWFLPVNVALICASAALLGAFGNRANLSDDAAPQPSQDNSNPYISAMLRGFFVYLIMISGLLLLDVNPFADPSPGQYIRLAGFLSLFGFVLSYQPRLFRQIIVWTYHRIEQKEVTGRITDKGGINVHHKRDVHESETIVIPNPETDSMRQLAAPDERRNGSG
jgi:hypothetical protein